MEFEKIEDATLQKWEQEVGKNNLIAIEKKAKNGDIEAVVYLKKPSSLNNYFAIASRFRQFGDELQAGELILKNCYLGGIKDFDTKQDKSAIRNSALYVGICIQCFAAANADFNQGAQGLGFRIM